MATEMRCGATIWMTGLCQSGKSTLAAAISEEWTRRGMVHEVIDGDMVRDLAPMGFDGKSIAAHLTRVALAAGLLNRHGVSAVVPVIAPLERVRRHCCQIVQEIGGVFRLVWVNTPHDQCARQDTKGLWELARAAMLGGTGGIGLAGYDAPFDEPDEDYWGEQLTILGWPRDPVWATWIVDDAEGMRS